MGERERRERGGRGRDQLCVSLLCYVSDIRFMLTLHSPPMTPPPLAATRSKLLLSPGATYHVTVRACNPSGLCAEVSSNGVTVDATPPTPGQVLDGLYLEDIQHQPSP